jgi:hypothetical protein
LYPARRRTLDKAGNVELLRCRRSKRVILNWKNMLFVEQAADVKAKEREKSRR